MISIFALSICAALLTGLIALLERAHSNSTKLLKSENERLQGLAEDLIRKMTMTPPMTTSSSWLLPKLESEDDPEPIAEGELVDMEQEWERLGLPHD